MSIGERNNSGELPGHPSAENDSLHDYARGQLSRWKRRTIILGVSLFISILLVVPFLKGNSLHNYFEIFGKYLIYFSMSLFTLFLGSATLTYNFWWYWRKVQKEFEPDGSPRAKPHHPVH